MTCFQKHAQCITIIAVNIFVNTKELAVIVFGIILDESSTTTGNNI